VAQVNLDERKVELRLLKAPDDLGEEVDGNASQQSDSETATESGQSARPSKRRSRKKRSTASKKPGVKGDKAPYGGRNRSGRRKPRKPKS